MFITGLIAAPRRWLPFLLLPMLAACSDERATFVIDGSAHALTLIRVTGMPWEKTAKYTVVAARMPDCMRRHALPDAGLESPVEVYSPGNNAWILRQDGTLFVLETRNCEGFARLDKAPESGLGTLMGRFEMQGDTLAFAAAPKAPPAAVVTPPAPALAAEPAAAPAPGETAAPVKN